MFGDTLGAPARGLRVGHVRPRRAADAGRAVRTSPACCWRAATIARARSCCAPRSAPDECGSPGSCSPSRCCSPSCGGLAGAATRVGSRHARGERLAAARRSCRRSSISPPTPRCCCSRSAPQLIVGILVGYRAGAIRHPARSQPVAQGTRRPDDSLAAFPGPEVLVADPGRAVRGLAARVVPRGARIATCLDRVARLESDEPGDGGDRARPRRDIRTSSSSSYIDRVLERSAAACPGVESVSVSNSMPLHIDQSNTTIYALPVDVSPQPCAAHRSIRSHRDSSRTCRSPLQGRPRLHGVRYDPDTPPVAIVNAAARRTPVSRPSIAVDRQVTQRPRRPADHHRRHRRQAASTSAIGESPRAAIFFPLTQQLYSTSSMLIARTDAGSERHAGGLCARDSATSIRNLPIRSDGNRRAADGVCRCCRIAPA